MSEDYLVGRNARNVKFSHGLVAAAWGSDDATAISQSDDFRFAITDIIVDVQTDLTTEAATQPVPVRCVIYSNTQSADILALHAGVPNHCVIGLNSPVLISKSENYETRVQLGGATAATCDIYLLGYDCV